MSVSLSASRYSKDESHQVITEKLNFGRGQYLAALELGWHACRGGHCFPEKGLSLFTFFFKLAYLSCVCTHVEVKGPLTEVTFPPRVWILGD